MKSVMSHQFSRVPEAEIQRSSFNRSHGYKTTFDAGYLVPVFVDEVLPGDTFNLKMTAFARLATPLKPLMDNLFLDSFFFFVPNRLLWDNWQKFNGEQDDPGDSTAFNVPYIVIPNPAFAVGSIFDYMGLPTETGVGEHVNALYLRAYNLIWNQWFRDQNLQDSVTVNKGNGPDAATDYTLLRRGKRHDYFTSCLPWPQKGTAVSIPLGTSAPVVFPTSPAIEVGTLVYGSTDGPLGALRLTGPETPGHLTSTNSTTAAQGAVVTGAFNPLPTNVYADLTAATAYTINVLRQAFQLQKLYERDARGGTRYTEIIKSHFGVTSPDARLQRPEYLGGGESPVNIHPVPQMSVAGSTPQGNLAAFGTAAVNGHGFSKSFTEHGVLIGLVSVRADLTYQQGLNRMWSRSTRWDYYWPALAHLGEQSVLNKEIYCVDTVAGTNDLVFGYQERYAEYRYKPSQITGKFRSTYATSLDVWHLSQEFGSLPDLETAFIEDNPPIGRVIAVNTEPHFLFDSYFSLICARPMPVYSVPGLIDHF